jgi:hypothetical protein
VAADDTPDELVRARPSVLGVEALFGTLPIEVTAVERGLKDVLRQLDALAARALPDAGAPGAIASAGALVALIAAAHLILLEWRKGQARHAVCFTLGDAPRSRAAARPGKRRRWRR